MSGAYVHGYQLRESQRLRDQAETLVDLLHADTAYPPGSTVLEAGCGVGAQTIALARNSPGARITSVDISPESIDAARARVDAAGITNVELRQADIVASPFADRPRALPPPACRRLRRGSRVAANGLCGFESA